MATRLYLTRFLDVLEIAPAFDSSWEQTTGFFRVATHTEKRTAVFGTSPRSETSTSGTFDVCHGQYISAPLRGTQTISGTVKGIIRALESAAAADLRAQMLIKIVSRDGGTVRGTLLAHDASALSNEFDAVTLTNRKFPLNWSGAGAALSSVSAQDGDRIVIELGWRAHNTSATSYTGSIELGDSAAFDLAENETDQLQGNPWIEFSQTLTFEEEYTTRDARATEREGSNGGFPGDLRTFERRSGEPAVSQLGAVPVASDPFGEYYRPAFDDYQHTTADRLSRRRPDASGIMIGVEPRDMIQPSIGSWAPLVGSTIENDDTIAFRVTDNLGELGRVVVLAEFTGGSHEVIHDGTGFSPYYAGVSTRTPIANGYAFSLLRSAGWAGPGLVIRIYASDLDGNEATPTGYAFTVNDPVLPDTYPPIVSNVSPAAGTELARTDPIFFDVTDDSGAFRRIIVTATFADGSSEVVHDGDGFAARYGSTSTRTSIAGGFRYRVRRTGGWPYGPTIRAYAIDPAGNENV